MASALFEIVDEFLKVDFVFDVRSQFDHVINSEKIPLLGNRWCWFAAISRTKFGSFSKCDCLRSQVDKGSCENGEVDAFKINHAGVIGVVAGLPIFFLSRLGRLTTEIYHIPYYLKNIWCNGVLLNGSCQHLGDPMLDCDT